MADQGDKGVRGLLNILMILCGLILLGMVGLAVLVYGGMMSKTKEKEAKIIEQKPEPGKIYDLGTFTVNLADEEVSRYARAHVQFQYSKVNIELDKEIKEREAQFKDLTNTLLNDRKAVEISTSEGKERFRRELQLKINQALKFGAITDIYLTEFAIQ